MRLLKLKLIGRYKGLENQTFDFSRTNGNIIALIGLNGSGKSQLLELLAEVFAYMERWGRKDFITRKYLPFSVIVDYEVGGEFFRVKLGKYKGINIRRIDSRLFAFGEDQVSGLEDEEQGFEIAAPKLPSYIVGYASGLNENLQRAFLKNSLQVYDVLQIKHKRRKELERDDVTPEGVAEINERFLKKYQYIYKHPHDSDEDNPRIDEDWEDLAIAPWLKTELFQNLDEARTPASKMVYIDYDSAVLLITALAILPDGVIADLFQEITYCIPKTVVMRYDLVKATSDDAVADIKLLGRLCGRNIDIEESPKGELTFDLTDSHVKGELNNSHYGDPFALFERLYKFQVLGIKNWVGRARQLNKDDFLGTVKKPLKTRLPLEIINLELANRDDTQRVKYDDLSDGEAQLMQILAAARIFCRSDTLFLLDEPETHLNPAWRTYFHKYLGYALKNTPEQANTNTQVFLSTHSPFMISSLYKEDVYEFTRGDDERITMEPVAGQTYGTSFEVLIKQYFQLKSLISQTVVSDVKNHLPEDVDNPEQRAQARQWIYENMGESMEKAYLLRKLED